MLSYIHQLLHKHHITLVGTLPLTSCRVTKPYLLEKKGITGGSVIVFAIPYYSKACEQKRNLSSYAVPRDYHLFVRQLEETVGTALHAEFPSAKFTFFADHSPIDERDAAARAGLGILGKNGLLITDEYSSYVFLAEIITDAVLPCQEHPLSLCRDCGACLAACPQRQGACDTCLSALTQKKGALTEKERDAVGRHGTVWGCDICMEVCPYTKAAKATGSLYTPIPFFYHNTLPYLTSQTLADMNEKDFTDRAYSWRGRETIGRNLAIAEDFHEPEIIAPAGTTETGKRKK